MKGAASFLVQYNTVPPPPRIPGSDIFVYWGPFALTLSPTNGVYHPYINFLKDISALLVM